MKNNAMVPGYSPKELEELLNRYFHGVSCRSTGSGGLLAWGLK